MDGMYLALLKNMMLAIIKIVPLPDKRNELLDILISMKTHTVMSLGCLSCSIYEEHGAKAAIVYFEQWQSPDALHRHIRSNLYLWLLQAMELSSEKPEIYFTNVENANGMELIKELRKAHNCGKPTAQ